MHFTAIAIAFAGLFVPASACGCRSPTDGSHIVSASETCCYQNGADWAGTDCSADSMSESLREYDQCCHGNGLISDCDYPDPIGDIFGS
ncbi:uncharacterized protein J7T54_005195 [Emericellopsis cladophorae]|uniref:Uncharacterized protein n=1 Tax=Emericellopsis cladophorae TaxID=2686198 RepID=A0A9P9XWZ6_9HYPO|nr:uncharacterized protein J7T54_005195 [Emericellopsis cladophorae]KAI6779381.1 hypothetical protein J7T54_005195 [Emericellopsis cladophorae]